MTVRRYALFAILLLLVLPAAGRGAELVPHLQIIGLDQVLTDPRFSGLTGAGQGIAVLDTGADTLHLGFANGGRVGGGVNLAGAPLPPNSPDFSDGHGHGTMVAGFAASQPLSFSFGGQDLTLRGIAPSADVLSVRVLGNSGGGSFTNVLNGLNWVLDNHAVFDITVVNMSLGTTETFLDPEDLAGSPLATDINNAVIALKSAGVTVVAASGNSGHTGALSFPAILHEVLSVGSTDEGDELSSFSNASSLLNMLAPGQAVWSTAFDPNQPSVHNFVGFGSGTSFSAPQVAGAVVLVHELFSQRAGRSPTPDEIQDILVASGVPVTFISSGGVEVTTPRLDLYNALVLTWAVPEPTTVLLLAAGGGALLVTIRRRIAA